MNNYYDPETSDDEPMTEQELERMREYFAGKVVVEYRTDVAIVEVVSKKPLFSDVDPNGGGASFSNVIGIDADGVRWRYYIAEYIWKDGTRFPAVKPAAYLRIGDDWWERNRVGGS